MTPEMLKTYPKTASSTASRIRRRDPSNEYTTKDPKLTTHHPVLTQVSPFCIILDDDNGFRSHVLPFAVQCPLVRRAVCVTAAFHLSDKVPSLRADAEVGRGIVIKMLQNIALQNAKPYDPNSHPPGLRPSGPPPSGSHSSGPPSSKSGASPPGPQEVFAESSWCCLILLILGDLITGSADMMALRKTLVSFREWRKRDGMGKGPLVEFLEYQSGLYETPYLIVTTLNSKANHLLAVGSNSSLVQCPKHLATTPAKHSSSTTQNTSPVPRFRPP